MIVGTPAGASFTFKTSDSPFFQTPDGMAEIEEARRNLTERDFKQEYEASFENFSGRIHYAFDRKTCGTHIQYDPTLPLIVGQDFNYNPMSSCIFQRHSGKLIQIDELLLMTSSTDEICRVLRQKYPEAQMMFRPDATGARHTSNSSVSDHQIIIDHGNRIECHASNPRRVDRWASVNRAFEKGLVKINLDACPKTVKDLELVCYKEGTCEPQLNNGLLGHLSDGFGYAVHWEFPILGKVRISRYA